jgi:hypothetical protein
MNEPNSAENTQESEDNREDSQSPPGGLVSTVPANRDAQDSERHARNPNAEDGPAGKLSLWRRFHDRLKEVGFHYWVMLLATIVIAVSTSMYTHYAAKQWDAMNGQLEQMRDTHLLEETRRLATNAGEQVEQLKGIVETGKQQSAASVELARQAKISAEATKILSETTARELELTQRPWISIDLSAAGPMTADSSGDQLPVTVVLRNEGQSPAVQVVIEPEIYLLHTGHSNFLGERKRICELAGQGVFGGGDAIFPGREMRRTYSVPLTPGDVESYRNNNHLSPLLIVCAGYQPMFKGETSYYTGVVYMVGTRSGSTVLDPNRIPVGETVPLDRILLVPFPMAGMISR